jgi:uncharacterized membrane protein YebE (DUF533 family)
VSASKKKAESNSLLATGAGVAALGVAGAALGAVCPLCVVAAPALVGAGVYKRWQARREQAAAAQGAPEPLPVTGPSE